MIKKNSRSGRILLRLLSDFNRFLINSGYMLQQPLLQLLLPQLDYTHLPSGPTEMLAYSSGFLQFHFILTIGDIIIGDWNFIGFPYHAFLTERRSFPFRLELLICSLTITQVPTPSCWLIVFLIRCINTKRRL